MRARSVSLGSMFGWIPATFKMVFGNIGAMTFASILSLLVWLVMAIPMIFMVIKSMPEFGSHGAAPEPELGAGFWIGYGLFIFATLFLLPPLMAGWYRLCDAAWRGGNVSGLQILAPYREVGTWLRLVGFVVLVMVLYVLLIGLMYVLFSAPFKALVAMQAAAALSPGAPPTPPSGALMVQVLLMYLVAIPLFLLWQFIYMVGLAEVTLNSTNPLTAILEASLGVLRNMFKLLLLIICVGIAAFALLLVFGVVAGVVGAGLALASPVLLLVFLGVFYLMIFLVIYPLMFSSNYLVWKDMLGDTTPPAITL